MKSLKIFAILSLIVVVKCQIESTTTESTSESTTTGTVAPPQTITTASGTRAPARGTFGSGDLIFEEVFEELDFETWQHENTVSGGGSWEFQWYNNNRTNSYVEDGTLHIVPSLLSDETGEGFLTSGLLSVHGGTPAEQCTDARFWGCERSGNPTNIVNPIKSARLRTVHSFSFKYGTLEVRAKMPTGDWLWPAIWLLPKHDAYGTWPSSGEIDLVEGRGNRALFNGDVNVGTEQVGSTMHFGPRPDVNGWPTAHFTTNQQPGFNENFHTYKFVWTNESITFFVDDVEAGVVEAGEGFWLRGGFDTTGRENPWRRSSSLMAPFDQEFYLIMNLAVGGVNYFSDGFVNQGSPKPWLNNSPRAATDFWSGRNNWLPTWNLSTEDSHLQVDYVRVWAL